MQSQRQRSCVSWWCWDFSTPYINNYCNYCKSSHSHIYLFSMHVSSTSGRLKMGMTSFIDIGDRSSAIISSSHMYCLSLSGINSPNELNCRSLPSTHTPLGWRPTVCAAFLMGRLPISFFRNWKKDMNCISFIASDIPPLPKELFMTCINLALEVADSVVKKHVLLICL